MKSKLISLADANDGTEFATKIKIGRGVYGFEHMNIYHYTRKDVNLSIGQFTAIGPGCTVLLDGNHDIRRAAQYPMHPESCGSPESEVDYVGVNIEQANKCSDAHAAYHSKGSVSIGSDVWIGLDATILSGVSIGHGAVIGKD
jgi:acetyltransferase-like isoleucine patch superfamily enzyme